MSTTSHTVENDTDCEHRRIDHERYVRALTEEMSVTTVAPGMMTVTHDGADYTVDLVAGTGECADYRYRDVICKHLLKAALAALYDEQQSTTTFVARIARFAREQGCVHGERGCAGPTQVGDRGFPCPGCVAATGQDEWTVWCCLIGDTETDQ